MIILFRVDFYRRIFNPDYGYIIGTLSIILRDCTFFNKLHFAKIRSREKSEGRSGDLNVTFVDIM